MKLLTLTASFLIGFAVASAKCEDLTFKTTDGREFKAVTVSGTDPTGIRVMTSDGVEHIPFPQLPAELQTKFGYDPQKAAAWQTARVQAVRSAATQSQAAAANEARFAPFTNAIAELKRKKLLGAQQAGSGGGSIADFEASIDLSIAELGTKLEALRYVVAQLDQAGADAADIARLIQSVAAGKIYVGMPAAGVLVSWGTPTDRNRSLSALGSTESWWYGTSLVSIESGRVSYIGQ